MAEFFGSMEDLLAPFGYRKHWAKGMDHTHPQYLMRQYPQLTKFLDYVNEFDPNGKFRNEHVNMWFNRTMRFSTLVVRKSRNSRISVNDFLKKDNEVSTVLEEIDDGWQTTRWSVAEVPQENDDEESEEEEE